MSEKRKRYIQKYGQTHIWFKDRKIRVYGHKLTGKCSNLECKNPAKQTHSHHIQYHDNDPLKDITELCARCHAKEGIKLGQNKLKHLAKKVIE